MFVLHSMSHKNIVRLPYRIVFGFLGDIFWISWCNFFNFSVKCLDFSVKFLDFSVKFLDFSVNFFYFSVMFFLGFLGDFFISHYLQ